MGCDIHIYTEVYNRKKEKWEEADTWISNPDYPDDSNPMAVKMPPITDIDRNYTTFTLLAGVRDTGGEVGWKPKGIPHNVSVNVAKEIESWGVDSHSHSYLTLAELLDYDWDKIIHCVGYLDSEDFQTWEKRGYGRPTFYSTIMVNPAKGIPFVKMQRLIKDKELEVFKITEKEWKTQKALGSLPPLPFNDLKAIPGYYIHEWDQPFREEYSDIMQIINDLETLEKDPNDVRIVFFFDN